jgi:hypothetical protein
MNYHVIHVHIHDSIFVLLCLLLFICLSVLKVVGSVFDVLTIFPFTILARCAQSVFRLSKWVLKLKCVQCVSEFSYRMCRRTKRHVEVNFKLGK